MNADERHLNLIFVLMNTRRPLTRDELRAKVGGYDKDASDDAFQRMFERDKVALRKSRIPLETVSVDPGFNDSDGYLIDRDKFLLPDLQLDGDDRAILAEAAKVWTDSQFAQLAERAAEKIGDSDEDDAGLGVSLGLALDQGSAATLFSAIEDGHVVQFEYLTKGDSDAKLRVVEPWQVLLSGGNWYLVGFDHSRQEQRTFKLARFKSSVTVTQDQITHPKPSDFDVMTVVGYWLQTQDGEGIATLSVEHKAAGNLRLLAQEISVGAKHDVLTIHYANEDLVARDIAAVVDAVLSIEPKTLREKVDRVIRDTMGRHSS